MTSTTMVSPRTLRASTAQPMVLAVLHPKGGVGRSTTVWQLGAELALRGKRVQIEDLDQGRHLSRVFERHPPDMAGLQLADGTRTDRSDIDLIRLDTAPEARREYALSVLHRADWVLVPVKGPEEGSVQALPMLMQWVAVLSQRLQEYLARNTPDVALVSVAAADGARAEQDRCAGRAEA